MVLRNDSTKFVELFTGYLRARTSLLGLETYEETRAIETLRPVLGSRNYQLLEWSRTQGIVRDGKTLIEISDPLQVLKWFEEYKEKAVLFLKDFHPYFKEPTLVRKLRDLNSLFKQQPKTMVLLSSILSIPAELQKSIPILELPLPSLEEIQNLVQRVGQEASLEIGPEVSNKVAEGALGLTEEEIENVLARSLVSQGSLDRRFVMDEKRQVVKKSGILEFLEVRNNSLSQIGGLKNLKKWLLTRKVGLSQEARSLNLPVPKGILLVGVPGCGKSLTASTISEEWELPLLRLDLGRIFSGLVGSSEQNVRNVIQIAEAVSPCVLWVDEIEKGLSGTKSGGDSGTSARVFGTLLTWMQEKKSLVFVIATANDISQLPPEFLRKGRFDEIFFVDLPVKAEREEIVQILIKKYNWAVQNLNLSAMAEVSDGFSGAELEQALIDSMYLSLSQKETLEISHFQKVIEETVPLSKTMSERIEGLRGWAKLRAKNASHLSLEEESRSRFEGIKGEMPC